MKKYILKKDLPFAKIGTEIILLSNHLDSHMGDYTKCALDSGHGYIEFPVPDKDFELWIEKTKPRLFWLNIHKSGDRYLCDSPFEARHTVWGEPGDNEIIKLCEVIE